MARSRPTFFGDTCDQHTRWRSTAPDAELLGRPCCRGLCDSAGLARAAFAEVTKYPPPFATRDPASPPRCMPEAAPDGLLGGAPGTCGLELPRGPPTAGLPFHRVRASSWCSRGWPSFPEPPLDHFRALDTKATRSGELGSIRLNSLARFSKTTRQTLTHRTGSLQLSLQGKADEPPAVCPAAPHRAGATQGRPVHPPQSQQPMPPPRHAGQPAAGSLGRLSTGSRVRVRGSAT